jgi:ketosteroid isomerase-like protein
VLHPRLSCASILAAKFAQAIAGGAERMRTLLAATAIIAMAFNAPSARAEPAPVDQLLGADKDFAAYADQHGTAAAFKAFMEPADSRAFEGGEPARGAEAIYQAHGGGRPESGKLSWSPDEAFSGKAGDMGVTWGHWRYTPADASQKGLAGHYVTVWRKDAEGRWKGLIDIGSPD